MHVYHKTVVPFWKNKQPMITRFGKLYHLFALTWHCLYPIDPKERAKMTDIVKRSILPRWRDRIETRTKRETINKVSTKTHLKIRRSSKQQTWFSRCLDYFLSTFELRFYRTSQTVHPTKSMYWKAYLNCLDWKPRYLLHQWSSHTLCVTKIYTTY